VTVTMLDVDQCKTVEFCTTGSIDVVRLLFMKGSFQNRLPDYRNQP